MSMPKIRTLPRAGVARVLASDFMCNPGERGCAQPKLAPGSYMGRLQLHYSLRGRPKPARIVLDDGRVLPLAISADGLRVSCASDDGEHYRAHACAMQVPHGRHYHGPSAAGRATYCLGDDPPLHCYYVVGEIRLEVVAADVRPESQINVDATPPPVYLPPPLAW